MGPLAKPGPLGLAALLLFAVLFAQMRLVSPTNLYGYDEWTVLQLVSSGVMDIPYANRPLALLWALPVPFIAGASFAPFVALRWIYAWLTAWLIARITLRLAPGRPLLAFLAAVFVLVWAPSDAARFSLVESALYWGITLGMTLSLAAFVESWSRRSVPLLLLAGVLAVISGRCYESTLPVLVLGPLLLLVNVSGVSRALVRWALVFEGFVGIALAIVAYPMFFQNDGLAYQESAGLDTRLAPMLTRLAGQYALHFGPLVTPVAQEFSAHAGALAVAVVVFLGALACWARRVPAEGTRGDLRILLAVALPLTGAGYVALVVTGSVPGAWRGEFLSAPGAAWLLAGLIVAAGERARRFNKIVVLALSVWVVALGTARSSTLQDGWRSLSFYSRQMGLLSDLVALAPDTQPGTLIVLIDEGRAWRANFSFQHAVDYLYGGRATGLVVGARPGMLPAYFTPTGIVSEPLPVVRGPWHAPVRVFGYDQVVVVAHGASGASVVEAWPPELPALPPGARYRPRERLAAVAAPLGNQRVLRSLEAPFAGREGWLSRPAVVVVFLLLLLPPGLVLLRLASLRLALGPSLGLALATGYMTVLSTRLIETFVGLPIVLPLGIVWLVALWKGWSTPVRWRSVAASLVVPVLMACLAGLVSSSDMQAVPGGGLAFRTGFDVSDRAIYAAFAEELERSPPPHSQNPLYAGVRSGYSFFPSLLGLTVHDYAPVSLLTFYLRDLPLLAFLMIGLCLDGLLEAIGIASLRVRALTMLLMILGGDLAWLLESRNLTALERTSRFFAFHSFSAESLYFNTWMLGLPLALAGLHAALRWLREGQGRALALAGFLLGGLWGTKVFACIPLLAGAWLAALLLRQRRLFELALASTLGVLPWCLFTWLATDGSAAPPLVAYPFLVVRSTIATIPALAPAAGLMAGGGVAGLLVVAALAPVFLVGSLGVRLLGLPSLIARFREDRTGFHRWVGISMAIAVLLGLGTRGQPVATDGAQFLTLALYLLWLYAGPSVAALFRRPGLFPGLATALVAIALVNPVRYLTLKVYPSTWASLGSWDRVSLVLPPHVTAACDWLRSASPPDGALLVPLQHDPGDRGGLKALYVAALAERRLVAYAADFGVDPAVGAGRRAAAAAVYATSDAALGERALQALNVGWLWEEPTLPLRFESKQLAGGLDSPRVRIHQVLP